MKFTLRQSITTALLAIAIVVSGYGAGLWQGYQTGHANGYSNGYSAGYAASANDSQEQFYRGIWYACVIVEISMFGIPPEPAKADCLSAVPQWIVNQDYETNTPEWVWPPK